MEITARVVADATVRKTNSEKEVTGFRVAVNRAYTSNGERKEETAFIECDYWRSTKIAPYITKGLLLQLSGFMTARAWVSRDGEPMAGLHFNTSNIQFLTASAKPDGDGEKSNLRRQR